MVKQGGKRMKGTYNYYELESLHLYNGYLEYMNYLYLIIHKYDKNISLKEAIEKQTISGLEYIIEYNKERNNFEKLKLLNKLDAKLKVLKTLYRISRKQKILNSRNYKAAAGKLSFINKNMLGCMKQCASASKTVTTKN